MKRAFTLIEAIVIIAILLILAALFFPVVGRGHPQSRRSMCQSNLKQIGLGFLQYAQDAGEKFPPARATSTTGWADVLQPYLKSTQIFQCPSTPTATPPLTDYFYNRRLARLSMQTLESSAQTILLAEGADDAPTWTSFPQLPASWLKDQNSPAWRHLDYGNYLFADGHVKSLKPSSIKPTLSNKEFSLTFAVR